MKTLLLSILTSLVACGDDGTPTTTGTAGTTDTTDTTDTTSPPPPTTDTMPPPTTDTVTPPPTTIPLECTTDICTVYGAAVPDVAADITTAALADPQFADDFAGLAGGSAQGAFNASLANFITDAYGCTVGAYTGPSMEVAHAGMGITQEEYDAFIVLIAGVLLDNGVAEADVAACFAPPLVDPAFMATIVGQ